MVRTCFSFLAFLFLASAPPAGQPEDTPAAILEHSRSVYAALTSYADTGTVTYQYMQTAQDSYSFTTAFTRGPRHLVFNFKSQAGDNLVVWADPGAFHVWWKTTGVTTEFPNPRNVGAITLSDYTTKGAVSKILPMLYAKAAIPGAVQEFEPTGAAVTEDLAGTPCFKLSGTTSQTYGATGKKVNVRALTVWIDYSSYLIRKILEEAPAATGMLNRTTTTFDPQANPKLNDDVLTFAPPK